MSQFNSKFASRSTAAQLVETGTGKSPAWTAYLTEKEHADYQATNERLKDARWGVAVTAGSAVLWGCLVIASGGTAGIISLAISGITGAAAAYMHSKHQDKVTDFRATAITRAAGQSPKNPQRQPSYTNR